MKKLTILAVILVLAIALTACGGQKTPETTTAATDAAVATPAATTAPQPLTLTSWNMGASTWSSPNGATIHITATPNYYEEGHKADFVVRLESDDVATVPCQWDGTNYTASVDLNAANGYCYYVVLTAADGTASEFAVNTPAEPTNEAYVNMEAALASYGNVIIEESSFDSSHLTLTSGKIQVQVPLITNDGESVSCQEAQLILSLNTEELGRQVLKLTQTDTVGLFEAPLENLRFDIPELENEQQVELLLNATLSNGHSITAYGGSWVCNDEGLLPIVG